MYVYDGVRKIVYEVHMNRFKDGVRDILHVQRVTDIIDMDYGNNTYIHIDKNRYETDSEVG